VIFQQLYEALPDSARRAEDGDINFTTRLHDIFPS
jgi:hypothetical protein